MKKIVTLLLLSGFTIGFAQIPAGYYNSATGTGFTLKTQLFNKIQSHTTISYTPGLWNLYYTSDVKPNGKVWDIYSSCDFTFGTGTGGNQDHGTGGNSECEFYNREHTFPQSWFASAPPMYSDAFIVMPTDKHVNGLRGNLAYGIVGTATFTSSDGTKIGNCVAPNYPSSLQVIEPADEYKGDIARNYFYMATCYQNLIGTWQGNDANATTVLDGSSDNVFKPWFLNMLLKWNAQDPVSQKEINRNNAVYAVQGNRNPYIDHPEYVCMIWSTACTLSSGSFAFDDTISIYPNPAIDHNISISSSVDLDEISLINLNGQIIREIKKPVFEDHVTTIDNLPQGFYFLKLSSQSMTAVKKVIVN